MTQQKTDRVQQKSSAPLGERMEELKKLFPEATNEDGIDFDALRNLIGIEFPQKERYSFTWAGKQEAVLSLQNRSKATLKPLPEESINWDSTDNLFIEGDNLEVLKLLYKSYFGRIKMIYIDPPYNTGNDFVYPDNYSQPLEQYLRLTGQSDAQGNLQTTNPDLNGHKHSTWLSMMYPRLFISRQLLKEDGLIFVSIDDREVHNLRLLMDEIFGGENFLACCIWHRRQMPDSRNSDKVSTDHEYVLVYRKLKTALKGIEIDIDKYANPDNDPRGPWFSADLTGLATKEQRPNLHYEVTNPETGLTYPPSPTRGWAVAKATFLDLIADGRILWPSKSDGRPRRKSFLNERDDLMTSFSTMLDVGFTTEGTREIQDIFGEKIIQFPKPVSLIKTLVAQSTTAKNEDIVLDFFAGSATTAQAVFEQNSEDDGNRKFILVQLPEPTGNPEFPTIAEIGKERIRRVIDRIRLAEKDKLQGFGQQQNPDSGFRVFKLDKSQMRQWEELPSHQTTTEEYTRQMHFYINDPLLEGWTEADVIAEIAIKEAGFGLTYTVTKVIEIEAVNVYRVVDEEKEQWFYICLDEQISLEALKPLSLSRNDLFIFRDSAITDSIVANLALTCRIKSI